jgi:DNA-binding CsgD family transcriptional regulator
MKDISPNKNSLNELYTKLVGCNSEFKAEHQFFNLTCLFTMAGFSFFVFINTIFEIDFTLTLIKLFVVVSSSILYYYSRVKYVFSWTSVLYFLMILFSLLFIGILNGGVTGGIAPIYTSILALMLFVTSGTKRIVLLAIWTLSISSLFILEYYRPDMITPYSNIQQKYVDIFLSYFSGIVIVGFVVVNVKKLYKKEQLNLEELIEKYRTSGFELKEIIDKKMALLSLREREICKLLLQGLSNQEIANKLFIETGTVKAHLNKIYKKLETTNRVDVINLMSRI